MRLTFTTEEHWKFLSEFARWECKAGGPDPHMVLSGEMSKHLPLEERLWRGGCYIAVYNSPYAEVLWRMWDWERIQKTKEAELFNWLTANFKRITMRRERRCVRRPDWMTEYLQGYARFVVTLPELIDSLDGSPEENFELVWDAVLTVTRLGRYVAIKLLEYYRRYCGADVRHPDIRPAGGISPREMLGYLWPDYPQVAEHDDSPEVLALVNKLVCITQKRLLDEFGVDLDMFQLQVMLCDYKQSWKGLRQYPGRSIDSEMVYALKMEQEWNTTSEIWPIRKRLFPHEHLGELQGWDVVRKDVAEVLGTQGYTWTDLKYDYKATKDLSNPVKRFKLPTMVVHEKGVYEILPDQLYQAGNWKRYDLAGCKARIQQFGLTGVVNLWQEDLRLEKLFKWYRHTPIPDGASFPEEDLADLVQELIEHLQGGGRVLVMCHAGRNRSGLVSALVVRKFLGCSGQQALQWVRAARPRAVANEAFEGYLAGLGAQRAVRAVPIQAPRPGYLF
jgi:hypothetical protein